MHLCLEFFQGSKHENKSVNVTLGLQVNIWWELFCVFSPSQDPQLQFLS